VSIIVGVDGSPESKDALRWEIDEAGLRGTVVHAVHVWQYTRYSPASPFLVEPAVTEPAIDAEELRRQAESRLRGIVAKVARGRSDVVIEQEVIEGHPSQGLLDAAKDADLLVVGSRGRGGFRGPSAGLGQPGLRPARALPGGDRPAMRRRRSGPRADLTGLARGP
jgi:nucleotide-binding universal stress UspA family protein